MDTLCSHRRGASERKAVPPSHVQHEGHDRNSTVLGALALLRSSPHHLLPPPSLRRIEPVLDIGARGPGEVLIWVQVVQIGSGQISGRQASVPSGLCPKV